MPRAVDELLISGLQHFAFCPRQWALIHIEAQWADDVRTVQGNILHEKTHTASTQRQGDTIITRSMQVFSHDLHIRGVCDVVEFRPDEAGITLVGHRGRYAPVPVEYKRGRPKAHDADALQLCAQALCLEEMLMCSIPQGELFYGQTRRRLVVELDDALRAGVRSMLRAMQKYMRAGHTPKVKTGKSCKSCSLADLCLPALLDERSAAAYMRAHLGQREDCP